MSRYDTNDAKVATQLLGEVVTMIEEETGNVLEGELVGWSSGAPRWLVRGKFEGVAFAAELEAGAAEITINEDGEFMYVGCVWADVGDDVDFRIVEGRDEPA